MGIGGMGMGDLLSSQMHPPTPQGFLLSVEEGLNAGGPRGSMVLGRKLLALEEPMGECRTAWGWGSV